MNRHCLGSQPFKYFVETDPTVPGWVKKIQKENIETWNTVLNKQDILEAGQHIIIDGNVISFDHTIDELANNFHYFKIGNERIFNDLRNYFITLNEEEFIPIDIMSNTAYMQWQDGLYYYDDEHSPNNVYKVVKNDIEYDVITYWDRATGDSQVFKDIINNLSPNTMLGFYKNNQKIFLRIDNGDLIDSEINYDENEPELNALFDLKKFFIIDSDTREESIVYILSDYDIRHPREIELEIIRVDEKNKVQTTDKFNSNYSYYTYNRNTDTYSPITLNENTFKQRQNGLYIRNSMWNPDTLLTSKNIDQLLYDFADTAYSRAKQNAYNSFVTNQLESYVNGRINSLNLYNYATNTALSNLENRFNTMSETYSGLESRIDYLSSTREYRITTGNGLKKTYVNENTLNQVANIDINIKRIPDGDINEDVKRYLRIEKGYNGYYIFNDLIFQDWQYELTPEGEYISDGKGGWQKEYLDHYIIGMPFTERLIPERVAVSSKAILEELNDNYEMKLISLSNNIKIVDIDYYKQLWGATGEHFTEDDFKSLMEEWYDVNRDWSSSENQAIMKMYTYNGENGEKLYRHQRAITFDIGDSEIKAAEGYKKIENPSQNDFKNRERSWYYLKDGKYYLVSKEDEYDSEKEYFTLGDQSPKNTIVSADVIARYTPVKLDIINTQNTNDYTFYLKNIINNIIDTADLNLTDTIRKGVHNITITYNDETYGRYTVNLLDDYGTIVSSALLDLPTERLVDHGEYKTETINGETVRGIRLYFVGYDEIEHSELTTFIPLEDILDSIDQRNQELDDKIDTTKEELEAAIIAAELETDNKTIKKYLKTDSNNFTETEDSTFNSNKIYYELKDGTYIITEDKIKQQNKTYYESINVKNGKNTLYATDAIIENGFTALGLTNGVGNITSGTRIEAGTTIIGLLKKMLIVPKDPTAHVPTITLITDSPVGTSTIQEVGTVVKPNMRYTFTQGYFSGSAAEYGTAYRENANCEVISENYYNGNNLLNDYNKDEYTYVLPEGTTTFKLNVGYSANTIIPKKNTDEDSTVKINAGTATANKTINARYKYFIGYVSDIYNIGSSVIRNLSTSNFLNVNTATSISNTYTSNGNSILIACPSKYKLSTITNGLGASIKDNFSIKDNTTIDIGGSETCSYKFYLYPITNGAQVEYKGISFTTSTGVEDF